MIILRYFPSDGMLGARQPKAQTGSGSLRPIRWALDRSVGLGMRLLANARMDSGRRLGSPPTGAAGGARGFVPGRGAGPQIQTPRSLTSSFITLV